MLRKSNKMTKTLVTLNKSPYNSFEYFNTYLILWSMSRSALDSVKVYISGSNLDAYDRSVEAIYLSHTISLSSFLIEEGIEIASIPVWKEPHS